MLNPLFIAVRNLRCLFNLAIWLLIPTSTIKWHLFSLINETALAIAHTLLMVIIMTPILQWHTTHKHANRLTHIPTGFQTMHPIDRFVTYIVCVPVLILINKWVNSTHVASAWDWTELLHQYWKTYSDSEGKIEINLQQRGRCM